MRMPHSDVWHDGVFGAHKPSCREIGREPEIEQTITQAIDQTRNEMRAEFAKQIDQLRAELAAGLTVQGARLRSELEAVIAAKKARGRKASLLRLPKPNGDAHPH
jgi:hypothetical protein